MAVRSGAGTGVVVSLVVFILTTVFLLILTIVFYSGQTKALEQKASADESLDIYVRAREKNNDSFKNYEDAARAANESVTSYLNNQLTSTMQYLGGAPNATLESVRLEMGRLGVAQDENVRAAMQDTIRERDDAIDEIDRLKSQLQSWEDENAELRTQLDQTRRAQQEQISTIETQIDGYRQAAEDYRNQLDDTVADMEQRVDRITGRYESQVSDLQNEIDTLSEERVVLITRVDELESKVRQEMITPERLDVLVDGRFMDTIGANDQVFIDRGRKHRIVLGMTFEVYDDKAALQQVDRVTGVLPRGKASLQVIKVSENTSTCKIVRSVPGRPVVREDVIANAVYDPNYEFKFLIHGKFDVDGDGRPTEAEAEYLRSLVLDWGGQVVSGNSLPGDLDFLVLGVEPPLPPPLRPDAPKHEMDIWVQKRTANQTYNRLMQQAIDAQIPVLNSNRFFVLTGYTVR